MTQVTGQSGCGKELDHQHPFSALFTAVRISSIMTALRVRDVRDYPVQASGHRLGRSAIFATR